MLRVRVSFAFILGLNSPSAFKADTYNLDLLLHKAQGLHWINRDETNQVAICRTGLRAMQPVGLCGGLLPLHT